jgi:hypothetical protein
MSAPLAAALHAVADVVASLPGLAPVQVICDGDTLMMHVVIAGSDADSSARCASVDALAAVLGLVPDSDEGHYTASGDWNGMRVLVFTPLDVLVRAS